MNCELPLPLSRLAATIAGALALLGGAHGVQAGTFLGSAELIGSSGTIANQEVNSFTPGSAVLPRDFSVSGTLQPGSYAIRFDLSSSGEASDDPSDDGVNSLRDIEFNVLSGSYTLEITGAFEQYAAGHRLDAEASGYFDAGGTHNVDLFLNGDATGINGRLLDFTSSENAQYGLVDTALFAAGSSTGYSGSGRTRAHASNFSGLSPPGALGGRNRSDSRGMSQFNFTVSVPVSFTLTSHFEGTSNPGSTQTSAVLPNAYTAATETFAYFDAPSGSWFEHPLGTAIEYQAGVGVLFTRILSLPASTDTDGLVRIEADGADLGVFAVGEIVDFGVGVSRFVIRDVEVAIDALDPEAFPVQLEFDAPIADFEVITVPEPGGVVLLGAGSLGLLVLGRRRRRSWQSSRGRRYAGPSFEAS